MVLHIMHGIKSHIRTSTSTLLALRSWSLNHSGNLGGSGIEASSIFSFCISLELADELEGSPLPVGKSEHPTYSREERSIRLL